MLQGFKASNGVFRTKSLFYETNRSPETPVFTLKEYDHVVDGVEYPSLRRMYLEARDPSERTFAMKAFGSWDQWIKLQEAIWFIPHHKTWRGELAALLLADAIKTAYTIMEDPEASSASKLQASKLVASHSRGGDSKSRGRPSNKQPESNQHITSEEEADAERIGLVN